MNNVVVAVFSGTTSTRTRRLWKIDKGMLLQLVGLNLPAAYQVHFSNNPDSGQATVVVATSDMVEIPYKYLQTGDDIYAWVYLTPENGIGYTIYMVTIPVRVRPDVLIEDPSGEQQNVVDSAIAALNSAVEQTAADVSAANEYAANAEAAQIGAEAAKTAAEAAQAESEINATSAAQNAAAAGQYASNANHYADTAEFYAEQAAQSAQNAANKASVAETSADEALLSARAASEAYNAANEAKDISIQASNAAKDYLRDANAAATNSEIYAGAASNKADQAAQNAANASENAIIAQQAKNEAEAAQSAAEAARDTAISNAQATITNANAAGRNADAAAESAELAASYLDTAISALNSGVESVQAAVAGVQDSIDAALQEAKDSGEFDGADGYTPVKGVDYFDGEKGDTGADGYSPAAAVTQTETGATVTVTDKTGTTTAEISNGQDGTTFTPAVSAEGIISWTNDGGKTNPQPVNIKGPQGDDYILTATDKEEIAQQVAVSLAPALDEKAPVIYCEASGAIASFTDGADDLPVQDLVVQIEPVQAGSGDPSPDNVRAISGWTGAKVTRTGKNLMDLLSLRGGTYDIVSTFPSSNITTDAFIPLKGGFDYCWSQKRYPTVGGRYIRWYNKDFEQLGIQNLYSASTTICHAPDDAAYARFMWYQPSPNMWQSVQEIADDEPMFELGSFATDYEPYQGETYDIQFQTEAGTIYGGSLDVTTGVLTVDRSQIASYAGETLPSTWISDRDVYSAGATPTTGAQVVYELATPQTYQLTPTEIRTLLGQNNIWADTGDTAVTYRADTKMFVEQNAPESPVQDVQVNGVSVLSDGVANVPVASASNLGVVQVPTNGGLDVADGAIRVLYAATTVIKAGTNNRNPITPGFQHTSAFYGLAKAAGDTTQSASSNTVGQYTESAKSAISQMLNGSVSVSGTAPTINALPGIRYICGEVTTIDITTPASGIIDVVFTSGSTPAVLTVTPPSGMTMKWANGFDPDNLEADTTYEINIADGCLGVAGTWS